MKSFKIISFALFSVLIISLVMTGCSRGENLEDLSVVEGVGIDLDGEKVNVTVQSLNLIKEGSGAEALSGNVTMNTKGTGSTISLAIDDVSKSTSKKLFFGQNRIVVFGMDMAENYLDKSLDYMLRSADSRSDVAVAAAKKQASDIMESPENDSLVPAQTISNLLNQSEKSGSGAHVTSKELLNAYADKTSDIYLPVLDVKDKNAVVSGIAVYNKTRLVKILNAEETFGFLFLMDRVKEGLLEFKDEDFGEISMNIISSKARVKADYESGKVVLKVKINTFVMLDELENGITNKLSEKEIENIEKLAENEIERLCKSAFDACVQNKSDALRIGEHLAMCRPKAYDMLSDDWDSSLANAELIVNSDCKLSKINENSQGN